MAEKDQKNQKQKQKGSSTARGASIQDKKGGNNSSVPNTSRNTKNQVSKSTLGLIQNSKSSSQLP